jgi:hypothetical protein
MGRSIQQSAERENCTLQRILTTKAFSGAGKEQAEKAIKSKKPRF